MSFLDTLGGYAGSLGDLLGKGLSFGSDVLGSAANIKSSLDTLGSSGPSYTSGGGFGGALGAAGAGPGGLGQPLTSPTASNGLGVTPTLLLFVGGLALVVYLARR